MRYLNMVEDMVLQNIPFGFHGIMESADEEPFRRIQSKERCLHNIALPIKHGYCELRNRGRNFVIPLCS
jgi:hypothetical protein